MQIKLTHILIENFKGIKNLEIDFGDTTHISGRNASGKTTISDAFSWLLFDKDSTGSSAFAIRPKDADGKDIDNIEIKVEATLDADGEEIALTKIQKQRWTKHRGSTAPTFEGNVNEFQINGYPAKKNEYDQKIRSLIDENLFKLITNPRTFPAMKWQDQRKTLMEFAGDITDEDILNSDTEKYAPIREDVIAAGADKAREKAVVTLRSLKKQQNEYPVRIDEAARNIAANIPDEEDLKKQSDVATDELKAVAEQLRDLSTPSKVMNDIQNQFAQKRLRMDEIKRHAAYEDAKTNGEAATNASNALTELKRAELERDSLCSALNVIESSTKSNKSTIKDLSDQYKAAVASTLPEDQTICPTCGRPFDGEKIEEIKQAFNERKSKLVSSIDQRGRMLRDKISAETKKAEAIKKKIEEATANVEELSEKYDALKAIADSAVKTDVTQDPEYMHLLGECDALEKKMASLDDNASFRAELEAKKRAIESKIRTVDGQLAAIRIQESWKQRVEELKQGQLDCGQKVADQEQVVYLLEEFTKAKMDLLSDRINGHFKKVRFRLFNKLINGAITETCTMQINTNGSFVDYSDANNAAQILGGLDVIEALSTLYGVTAPIFLDNAEAIDTFNTPKMDAQLILLEVTDHKELYVERS